MTSGQMQMTDIGMIHADWELRSLSELGEPKIGLTYSPADVRESGTLVLRSSNVQNDRLAFDDNVYVRSEIADGSLVEPGDILICVRNGSRALIGKCALIDESAKGMAFGAFMSVFRSPHSAFLFQQFRSDIIGRQIAEHLGATINQITNGSLKSFRVPFPPDGEERASIAQALSDIDALIASLDALIAKKRDIKQGAMQELLTGKRRLPGFSGEWSYRPLRNGLSQSATYGIVKAGLFQDSGIYMLRGGDIRDGRIVEIPAFVTAEKSQEFSRTVLNRHDVVISLVGYPGECAVIPDWLAGGNISRAVGLLRTNSKLNSDFLACYLNSPVGRTVFLTPSAGSAQIVVNLNELNKMPMPFPNLDEQKAIAGAMAAFGKELWELENRRAKIAELRQGMMQQLLTGRIRLV